MRRPLIAGNWKMNGDRASLAELDGIAAAAAARPDVDVAICPPFTLIEAAARRTPALPIGGQDCHGEEGGAYTGCTSAAMLVEAGASYVIVGHSERRRDQKELNRNVRAKAARALAHGLTAIICLGENEEEHDAGQAHAVVERRLEASVPIADGAASHGARLVIAYEPLWAIGTGRTPSLRAIADIHALVRVRLADLLGAEAAEPVRVLYGGSVTGRNAHDILALHHVDGALVGGASLTADAFAPIVGAAPVRGA